MTPRKYGQVALTGESARLVSQVHDLGGRWFDIDAFRLGAPERRQVAVLFADITERVRTEETTNEYAKSLADLNRCKDEFLAVKPVDFAKVENILAAARNPARGTFLDLGGRIEGSLHSALLIRAPGRHSG